MKTNKIIAVTLLSTAIFSNFTTLVRCADHKILIEKGTVVRLELAEGLTSQESKTGDTVRFTVIEDVTIDGNTVIREGSEALGRVSEAKAAKGWGKSGKLDITIETVKAIDGSRIPLTATVGDSESWAGGKTIVGVALLGLAFGGGMKGKKATIPKGTKIDVFVAYNTKVNPAPATTDNSSTNDPQSKTYCLNACDELEKDEFKTCMDNCKACYCDTCSGLDEIDFDPCMQKCF